MKTLCWTSTQNGKRCKNYKLKDTSTCAKHLKVTLEPILKSSHMLFEVSVCLMVTLCMIGCLFTEYIVDSLGIAYSFVETFVVTYAGGLVIKWYS